MRGIGIVSAGLATAAMSLGAPSLAGQDAPADRIASSNQRTIVLSFDDLPMTGGAASCDAALVERVTTRLTDALSARSIPSVGLATPGRACVTDELLQRTLLRWQAAGAVIGNHTATHPDLNNVTIDAYLADIDRAQDRIDAAVTTNARWFRPPLLHSGDTERKKRAVLQHLAAGDYRIAPVTIDNQEWVYAAVYQRARDDGDDRLATRVVDGYLGHLEESVAFYEELSVALLGREIPQVLLLHANLINADHLGRVIDMLERRGYQFTELDEALTDPAYQREDTYVGPRGLSWLQRWALADGIPIPPEPREAEWVRAEFRAAR